MKSNVQRINYTYTLSNGGYNIACGEYSAIQGGCGNTIPFGQSFVGVFGCNITSVNDKIMHLNNLWLDPASNNTSAGTPLQFHFAPGTVYVDTTSSCNFLRVF